MEKEALISLDFSENYSFDLQDEVQSFHWNNNQATIHPIAIYYNHMGEINFKSFVVISECIMHNTIAVYTFQKKLIMYLKNIILTPEKYIIFLMAQVHSIKIEKNSRICVIMKKTSIFLLNGIFMQRLIEKENVTVLEEQ